MVRTELRSTELSAPKEDKMNIGRIVIPVLPILFLMLSSYLLQSWWMLGASVLFGIGHFWVSAISL